MLKEEERKYLDEKYELCHRRGNNRLLSSVMRCIRKERKILKPDNEFSIFEMSNLVQLWLQTPACRYSEEGMCTICNYWAGQKIQRLIDKVEEEVCIPQNADTILINTCGSCLDQRELTLAEQEQLFKWLGRQHAKDIIFETHMATLSEDTVQRVHAMLPDKKVFFEIGQESIDKDVQFYCLNKPLSDAGRKCILDRIRRYGMESIVNVILGAPFLNRDEQIADAIYSINELLQEGADYIMLFPVNIKPDTLIHFLYKVGLYEPIDGEMIVRVLEAIPEQFLSRINTAWYGEHQETGVISPNIPEEDKDEFYEIMAAYNSSNSTRERKEQVRTLLHMVEAWNMVSGKGMMDYPIVERLDKAYNIFCTEILEKTEKNSHER